MCGRKGPTTLVELEGSEMRACAGCAKMGTPIIPAVKKKQLRTQDIGTILETRKKRFTPKDVLRDTEWELIDDYGAKIMQARQRKGLSQKDLAQKLRERQAILAKVEHEEFRPDARLIGKLEKFLGITLKESVAQTPTYLKNTGSSGGGLTLGDLIKMKKK